MSARQGPATWLFTRENETMWIVRAEAYLLLVFGPGSARRQYRFGGDAEMQVFHVGLTEQLRSTGWTLWAVNRDRRHGERRRVGRDTPDRRMVAQEVDATAGPQQT